MNEIRITGDGSNTLFNRCFSDSYHSTFGAITESMHVFINSGLHAFASNPVTVFEIGFGTGLNAYLACLDAQQQKRKVRYYAIEKYPLENGITSSLNYPGLLASTEQDRELFSRMHEAAWEKPVSINPYFSLQKIRGDLQSFNPGFHYDVVFFDAFAPDKQPEMWTADIFRRLYQNLNPHGVFTTYCVKGQVKRLLKETGFMVEKLPGPPGKREILRALKPGMPISR